MPVKYADRTPEQRARCLLATAKWRANNPDKNREMARRRVASFTEEQREFFKAQRRAKYAATADTKRARARAAYHKTGRDYQRRRNGLPMPTRPCPERCECCGGLPGKKVLALDHDHDTGTFRGWLCDTCNRGLGFLGDNAAGVQRALNYLSRSV